MICRPSQLLNLGIFLRVLILIPVLLFLHEMLRNFLPVQFLSEQLVSLLMNLPALFGAIAGICLILRVLQVRSTRYEITPEELKIYSGIFRRKHEYIELYRVKDFKIERPLGYRLFGLGILIIYTSDKTAPVLRMEAIKAPEDTYTVLRGFVERGRREKRVFEVD